MKMLLWLKISLVIALLTAPSWAQEPSGPTPATPKVGISTQSDASISLRWVDARGNVYPGGKISRMQWVWSRADDFETADSPALRLYVTSELPPDWVLKHTSGEAVRVVEPFKTGPVQTQTMTIDVRSATASLRATFADKRERLTEMTLAIQTSVSRPYVLIRPECGQNDLRFMTRVAESRSLYVGLSCVDTGDAFDITFFRSLDSSWSQAPGLVQFDSEGKYTAFRYRAPKPKVQVVYSQRLFTVGTVDQQNRASEYSIFYNPSLPPPRFYASAGVGETIYSYQETNPDGSVKLSQNGLTGKLNLGYRLVPRILDIAFNGFATLLPISHSPQDIPAARFYGLNGRLGYRLPVGMGHKEFMFLTGWYFWAMQVKAAEDKTYGIAQLSGPQMFLMMIDSSAGRAGWWTYFKVAMISDRFKLTTFANRELAIGGGIELSKRETKPFALTLDIAHTQFGIADEDLSMKLLSVTLGIQKPIF